MWLRSEVTDQSHLRLTAKVLNQITEATSKQSHSKSNSESVKRKKEKSSSNRKKHKGQKYSESQKPETSSQAQFSTNNHSESSNQYSTSNSPSSSFRNRKFSKKRIDFRKAINSGEVDSCSKSSRLLEKIKSSRASRRIGGIALKQSIVRSKKLNAVENNGQLTRIIRKTRWPRKNESLKKDSFYDNGGGGIFNKKNYNKNSNNNKKKRCNKKNSGEEVLPEKTGYKKHNPRGGLIKSIQKRTGFGEETSKISKNIGVSKLQRKSSSSFRLPNTKQKCNIKCCDKKCLNKNIDNCTNAMERLDLINENEKSNLIVLSQYVNPLLQVNSTNEKSNDKLSQLNNAISEAKNSLENILAGNGGDKFIDKTINGINENVVSNDKNTFEEKENFTDLYSSEGKEDKFDKVEENQLSLLENSCKIVSPSTLTGKNQ